jgi:prepilin-type N-terminal cleavage/methylation domain-containing protein
VIFSRNASPGSTSHCAEPAMTNRNGFTLVEILVALIVFLVGSMGIISLFGIAASSQTRAIAFSNASRMAEDLFTMLEARMVVNDGANNGLLTAGKPLPDNDPPAAADFKDSAKYPGYQYKLTFFDINPQAGQPGAEPEIMAVIYIRWPSEGNDFRVGDMQPTDQPNNYEGRVFSAVILRKPW